VSIPCGTSTLSFLFVGKSKSNSGLEEAITNLQNKVRTIRDFKNNMTEIGINY
jgi:hypothetical protein